MSFISTANHIKFCNILEESITILESNKLCCEKAQLDDLPELKKDLNLMNGLYNEYNHKLKDLHRLIKTYAAIEKRARIILRQKRLLIEKMNLKNVNS